MRGVGVVRRMGFCGNGCAGFALMVDMCPDVLYHHIAKSKINDGKKSWDGRF